MIVFICTYTCFYRWKWALLALYWQRSSYNALEICFLDFFFCVCVLELHRCNAAYHNKDDTIHLYVYICLYKLNLKWCSSSFFCYFYIPKEPQRHMSCFFFKCMKPIISTLAFLFFCFVYPFPVLPLYIFDLLSALNEPSSISFLPLSLHTCKCGVG